MKNSMICAGSFRGGEIEPGTFHVLYLGDPTRPDAVSGGTMCRPHDDASGRDATEGPGEDDVADAKA